ncbi:MAG: hypothetical protein R2851_25155 [Caldilineaceae bacterium]
MTLDTTTLGGWIAVLPLIGGVLRLNVDAFHAAVDSPRGLGLAVAVFMVSGAFGRAGPERGALRQPRAQTPLFALCGGALVGLVAASLWALTIWLALRFVLGTPTSLRGGHRWWRWASRLAFSASFFPALPRGGLAGLRVWVFITILVGVGVVAELTFWPALLACVLGWLLLELLTRLPLFDVARLRAWVWRLTTGRPQRYEGEDLAAWLATEAHAALTAGDDPRLPPPRSRERGLT